MSCVLSVKNLKKVYGKKRPFLAMNEISFSLRSGEILGLLGPNGSGKTTTIQILLGTLSPTSGEIFYFEKDFFRYRSEVLQQVSFASTYASLPFLLSVRENLRCFGGFYGFTAKETERRIEPLLERFGILEKLHSSVASLSAGQITRLMLVKAFFTHPKIVLLDEPTASLDPDMGREVCNFLLEQRTKTGLSILFTSHKMEEVTKVCDRAIFLQKGKIIADDLPKNLARSISSYHLYLTITDGLQRAVSLAEEQRIPYEIDHRVLQLSLEEQQIPLLLHSLMQHDVSYSNIQIEEPSLEDYFLNIVEQ
jgi:ABC-2 type transport system ATP-binding protein